MATVILHLGSNKGDRHHHIQSAYNIIEKEIGNIKNRSSLYETKAWGMVEQNSFLNSATIVESNISPFKILHEIHNLESALGRKRIEKWGPREIDVDIIFYDNLILQSSILNLPHPHFANRGFVLKPLLDIAPEFIDPSSNKTISDHYENFIEINVGKVGE